MNKRQIGKTGEQIAADYLVRNGFTILEKNFRSGRFGEIDIIAEEDSYLCFVEVKMRTSDLFGAPSKLWTTKEAKIKITRMDLPEKEQNDRKRFGSTSSR